MSENCNVNNEITVNGAIFKIKDCRARGASLFKCLAAAVESNDLKVRSDVVNHVCADCENFHGD